MRRFKKNELYLLFLYPVIRAIRGPPFASHFARVCAAGITGLPAVKSRTNPVAARQPFLNAKCRY